MLHKSPGLRAKSRASRSFKKFAAIFASASTLGCAASAQESAKPAEDALPPVVIETEASPKKTKKAGSPSKKKAPVQAEPEVVAGEADSTPPEHSDPSYTDPGSDNYGADGYKQGRSTTATKTDTPLLDVPQSITVITKERADDQHAVDLKSALQYVPGITVAQGEGNRDQINIRGQNTTADFFTDGVRDDVQYFRDLYNIDRVEILKGGNAMIFGRGGGGGVVNRVTKKAGETHYEGTVWGGSFDTKRATVDVGQKVNDNFAVRINGLYEDSGSYRDGVDLERYGINPNVLFKPSDQTKIWLSYEHFHDERTADRGIPSFLGVPSPAATSQFFGNSDLSVSDFTGNIGTATIEHKFSEALKIRNHTLYGDYDKFYQNVYASGALTNAGTFNSQAYNNTMLRETFVNQTDLTHKLRTDQFENTLLVGTEFVSQDQQNFRFDGSFNTPGGPTTIAVPFAQSNFSNPVFFDRRTNNNKADLTVSAAYVQDQLDFGLVQLIGGLRFERFDLDYTNVINGTRLSRVDEEVSPRAGAIFKPFEDVSFYASYSKSYLPYSGDQFQSLDATTDDLKPEEFINREIGAKWDIAPRLMFTAALFQLDRENTRAADPANPGFTVQTGSTRTEGGEVELNGYITDDWQVSVGYARLYSVVNSTLMTSATTTLPAGRENALIPENQFSFWNRYQLTQMFGLGVGVLHQSESYASTTNTVTLPSFTRVDGALFFNLNDNWKAQFNVENIFDEKYYPHAHNDNNISIGSPRAYYVGVTSSF